MITILESDGGVLTLELTSNPRSPARKPETDSAWIFAHRGFPNCFALHENVQPNVGQAQCLVSIAQESFLPSAMSAYRSCCLDDGDPTYSQSQSDV